MWAMDKADVSSISSQRSVSENSLVAMDFSGTIGRVIDNPVEAQSAALEEAHTWRVSINNQVWWDQSGFCLDLCARLSVLIQTGFFSWSQKRSQRMNTLGSPSPLHTSSLSGGTYFSLGFLVCTWLTTLIRLFMFKLLSVLHRSVIHKTQLWFHGRISREESHRLMHQQGQVDGYAFSTHDSNLT